MPALFNNLTFVGTGEPIKPYFGDAIRLNREPSERGINFSGVETLSDFRRIISTKINPTPQELGQSSARIARKISSGTRVDLIA